MSLQSEPCSTDSRTAHSGGTILCGRSGPLFGSRLRYWAAAVCLIGLALPLPAFGCQSEKIFPGELAGLDQSEALRIVDSQPIEAQQGFLLGLLYRARKTMPASWAEFSVYTKDVSLEELIRNPKPYRGWVFQLSGRAVSAEWIATGQAGPEALGKYCRVKLRTVSGQDVVIDAIAAPQAWTGELGKSESLDEPAACYGFFAFRPVGEDGSPSAPYFVAQRVEWYPEKNRPAGGLSGADGVALAASGFDLGLLDLARQHNLRPLSEDESPAFYGMLAASSRAEEVLAGNPPGPTAEAIGFFELVKDPRAGIGRAVDLELNIRRVIPVALSKPHQDLGQNFYQLDGFYRLGDTPLDVRGPSGETLRYQSRFPVTVNSLRLQLPYKEYEGKRVRVQGWLYRFWRFDSEFSLKEAGSDGQLAPLLIARQIEVLPETGPGTVARLSYIAIAAALFAIGFVWWVSRRSLQGRGNRPNLPEKIEV